MNSEDNNFRKIRFLRKFLKKECLREFKDLKDEEKKEILEASRLERRLTYSYDFYTFCQEALEAETWGDPPMAWAKVHRRLCRFIRRNRNLGCNILIQLPRYHLKTQICTIFYRIWRMVHDPNLCSLVVSGTLELSKATSRAMKGILRSSDKLKNLYSDVINDELWRDRQSKWSETAFNVQRTKDLPQCTIEAVGVGATVTGKHFTEISFDDLVTPENATTPEQCDKVIQSYRYFLSIINPKRCPGKIPLLIVGTPYNDLDLYTFLKDPTILRTFKTFTQPLYDELGKPIWPEMFTAKVIAEIMATQGTATFNAQYLLDPIPADQLEFRREWLKFMDTLPKDMHGNEMYVERYALVDPITWKKTTSTSVARGVILIVGIDKGGTWYVLDYKLYTRAKESEMFKGIFDMQDKHGFTVVGWESVAYQAQGKHNLDEEIKRRGRRLRVIGFHPGHTDKDVRIRSLIPYFERGQIYLKSWMSELILELTRFPYGKTKDIIDMLSAVPKVLPARGRNKWNHRLMRGTQNKAFYR